MAVSKVSHGELRDHVNVRLAIRVGDDAAFCAVPNNLRNIELTIHVFALKFGVEPYGKGGKARAGVLLPFCDLLCGRLAQFELLNATPHGPLLIAVNVTQRWVVSNASGVKSPKG